MKEMIKNSPAKFAIIVGVAIIVVASAIFGITKLAGNINNKPSVNVGGNGTNGSNNDSSGEDATEPSGEGFTEPSGEDGATSENDSKPSGGDNGDKSEPDGEGDTEGSGEDFTEPSGEDDTEPSGEDFTEPGGDNPTKPSGVTPTAPTGGDDGTGDPFEKPTIIRPTVAPPTEPTIPDYDFPTEPIPTPTVPPTPSGKTPEQKFKDEGGKYEVKSDGTVTITDGGKASGAVVIPTTIDGKKVSEVGPDAYFYNKNITSITVDCEVIEVGAFASCENVKSIIIGPNVKKIENGAFSSCTMLTSVDIQSKYLTELPGTVFSSCTKLTSITLPSNITRISMNFITANGEYGMQYLEAKNWHKVPELKIYIGANKKDIEMYVDSRFEKTWNYEATTYEDEYGDIRYVYELGNDVEKIIETYVRGNVTVIYK